MPVYYAHPDGSLTTARIHGKHVLATGKGPFTDIPALPSSVVRSTLGVNAHLGWQWGPYASNTATQDATVQAIIDLGAGYFRDAFFPGAGDTQQNRTQPMLLAAGVKFYAGFFFYDSPDGTITSAVNDLIRRYPNPASVFDSIQCVNEPDDPGVDWKPRTVALTRELHDAVRSHPELNTVPLISPALRLVLLADIPEAGPYFDQCCIHHYPVAGKSFIDVATQAQSLDYKISTYNTVFPGKKISVDEYGTVTSNTVYPSGSTSSVPEEVTAVYHPRAVCEAVRRGVRICMYELHDQSDKSSEFGAHFGLVDTTGGITDPAVWRRKQSFGTLARLTGLTRDDGPAFTPAPLRASISGTAKTVVLGKRTGEHGVLHWRDDLVYNGTTKTMLAVAPATQTVAFAGAPRTVTLTDVVTGTVTDLGRVKGYTATVAGNVVHARIV